MKWSFLLGVAPSILGLVAFASLACTSGEDTNGTPAPTQVPAESPTPTPTPSPTPTPVPISIPPQVTLDLDPSLTEQETEYLKRVISQALTHAELDFGFTTPRFTLFAYREAEAVIAKRAAWKGETVAQSSNKFPCNFCAETDTGVVLIRLGPGWFDEAAFPGPQIGMAVATHEIYHVFQLHALGGKNFDPVRGPAWMLEGSAQWLAFRVTAQNLGMPWDSVAAAQDQKIIGDPSTLESLEGLRAFSLSRDGYALGFAATEVLVKDRQITDIGKFYSLLGQGQSWESSFQESFGFGLHRTPSQEP